MPGLDRRDAAPERTPDTGGETGGSRAPVLSNTLFLRDRFDVLRLCFRFLRQLWMHEAPEE